MNTVIVKYNAGNIQSVLYALERIGLSAVVTDDHETVRAADRVIFPGVGEASTAMHYLKQRNLDRLLTGLQQPVLGICLGMQLMCAYSEENDTACLGIFEERVKRFDPGNAEEVEMDPVQVRTGTVMRRQSESRAVLKVPQIGWNTIYDLKTGLFKNVREHAYIYLVHSYYASLGAHTIATAEYGQPYSAALCTKNFYGVQFHPEKSADVGEQILRNFLDLKS